MKKHWLYLKYFIRHKWFVLVAGLRVGGVPIWRLLIHDWSKLLPCEWFPYAMSFYGPQPRSDETKRAFDAAWLHHQHLNPHHWQHWILREDSGKVKLLEMPPRLLHEMAADWMGAGRAITGKWESLEWYRNNQELIQLEAKTRQRVERILWTHSGRS